MEVNERETQVRERYAWKSTKGRHRSGRDTRGSQRKGDTGPGEIRVEVNERETQVWARYGVEVNERETQVRVRYVRVEVNERENDGSNAYAAE